MAAKKKTVRGRSNSAERRSARPPKKRPAPRKAASGSRPLAKGERPALARVRKAADADAEDLTIVGVGASAGGLEAFSALLRSLPLEPGVAIVFVQHLAPQHESALVTLLSGQSALPVIQATEGLKVERNHVYVIPPNARMVITGRKLHLTARPGDRTQYTPVDSFLSSLAQAAGARAIGVILSGTASDGALGIRDIKAAGGLTFAQAPATAKYDGMPRAAIATGMVDRVLPAEAIGVKLAQLSSHAYGKGVDQSGWEPPFKDDQLHDIFDLLRPASGVDFRHYKLPTIRRRLFRRMALHRLNDIDQYIRVLRGDAGEVRNLYQDLLIHVTRFFREPESFEALAREVFPAIVDGRPQARPIRAWVSGCATGEEAYSLAIALVEYLQRQQADTAVQIFATDVSETAVEQARTGVYPASIEGDVTPDRLRRFFTKHDGGFRVTKTIRDMCVFARQDLTKDPPFSRLDLILCRNVLIYMDTVLQKKLLSVFHYALNPHGFLVLGQAETVGAHGTLFSLVDKKFRVHRKKVAAAMPTMTFPVDYTSAGLPARKTAPEPPGVEKFLQNEVSRVLMERFAPPGVVIDSDMQIVQFRGQTGPYLEPAPGEASLNLLKMSKEGLLYGLRTAIHTARKTRNTVRKDGLQLRTGSAWRPVSVEVIPLAASGRPHYLVLFDESIRGDAAPPVKKVADVLPKRLANREKKTQVDFLQRELAASREYLQSIIQELEAANEELQSANEEILSSNEELQSTNEELDTAKEELQSTNEELNTVNEELHGRNEELSRVNSDLINLLGSVQIAIVIVSAELRIRRFTPMAEKVLNLIPADADRLIGHINPNIVGANLEELISECIDTIAPIEREVQDRQGRWYSLRIRPYRSVENRIDGAVLALFDIDAPKRFEEALRSAVAMSDGLMQVSAEPLAILDSELRLRSANTAFSELVTSFSKDGWRGRPLTEFVKPGPEVDDLKALVQADGATPSAPLTVTFSLVKGRTPIAMSARTFASYETPSSRMLLLSAGEGTPSARETRRK
jgi:two-component system CheB/CheR fusion protein